MNAMPPNAGLRGGEADAVWAPKPVEIRALLFILWQRKWVLVLAFLAAMGGGQRAVGEVARTLYRQRRSNVDQPRNAGCRYR